jgi:NAD(P)-dependent dehydrogenase (short-subunit alcohol dehydrogenase family)
MPLLDFNGRVIVVTGAARGMGAAHARELARRGARVVVNDLGGTMYGEDPSAAPANAVAEQIVADGGIAVADGSDVGTSDGCAALIAHAAEHFGQIDGVLHNAGIGGFSPIKELDEAAFEKMLRVHLFGALNLSREAWPHLARTHGRLLFIGSGAGLYGVPTLGHYAAAKVGMVGLARVAASEGEADGISANVLAVAAASRMMDVVMADAPNMKAWFHEYMRPELPSAAAVWLLHPDCPANGQVFEAFGPHFAEVFIAETVGRSRLDMTAEDVRDLFDEIQDRDGYIVPTGPDDFHGHMFRFIVDEAGARPLPADDAAPTQIAADVKR